MAIEIIEITNKEIIGRETRKLKMPIKKLIEYSLRYGFKNDGTWYFRISWMSESYRRLIKEGGLIKKVGTVHGLREKSFPFPSEKYYEDMGSTVLYKINNKKLNEIISNNGKATESKGEQTGREQRK